MMEENDFLPEEDNYYQRLNVSRTATLDEINSSYRRLSLFFHPDKHRSNEVKHEWAGHIFSKMKEAYEVLSDTHKRAIYDTLGKRGLEVDGWELIFRTRTSKEIREEYERLKREGEERRLQQSANPRGTITLSINATDFFMKYQDKYEILEGSSSIPNIEVSSMSIQQSIDAPVSLRNTMTLSGNISTQNGIGNGNVTVSNRYLGSDRGWTEMELGMGDGPMLGFKIFRTLSRITILNCGTVLQFTSKGFYTSFVNTLGLQLDAHSMGYLTYRIGNQGSSMSTIYVKNNENYQINAAVQIGKPHCSVSFNIIYKWPQMDMKIRLATKLTSFGVVMEYGVEKKVSQNSNISAAVSVGIPSGVTLKIKWTCSSQTVLVPIMLSEELTLAPVFYATVLPMFSWMLLNKLVLEPIAKEKSKREKQRAAETNHERLLEMQREAYKTIELMRETYSRIRSEEEKKKGLVILKALYGKLPTDATSHDLKESGDGADTESSSYYEVIDVTIPLQCLTRDSRLELQEAPKYELLGFYDPCVGEEKHLTIQYKYHDNIYCCTIADKQAIILPRNNHKLNSRS